MTTQHTPGPWELRQSSRDYWFIDYDQGGEGYTLTKLDCGEKDARLISAAPELLAALEGLLNALPSATTHPAIKAARAAIAKATGEAA